MRRCSNARLISIANSSGSEDLCTENAFFRVAVFKTLWSRVEIVDSSPKIRRSSQVMAPNVPYVPSNPLRPRASGGVAAEGMKKQIPANSQSVTHSVHLSRRLRSSIRDTVRKLDTV